MKQTNLQQWPQGFWLDEAMTEVLIGNLFPELLRPKISHKPLLMWKCQPINVHHPLLIKAKAVLLTPRISLPLHISLFAHPSVSHLWCLHLEAGALHKEKCLLSRAADRQSMWESLRFVSLMSVPARNCTSTQKSLRESASLLRVFHTQNQRKSREPHLYKSAGINSWLIRNLFNYESPACLLLSLL